jgi:hypothetical protein
MKKRINTKASDKLLPKAYRPLSPWSYFWRSFLYTIPVIGLIFVLIHAFASKSRHGRSYARFYLLLAIVAIIVAVVSSILLGPGIAL